MVFGLGVEAGAGLVDTGEVAVAEDAGRGVVGTKGTEQGREGGLLEGRAGVGRATVGVETALVADADGVLVVMTGMGAGQILMTGLIDLTIACDVVVITGEPETGIVTCDEVLDGEPTVAARGAAVNND